MNKKQAMTQRITIRIMEQVCGEESPASAELSLSGGVSGGII